MEQLGIITSTELNINSTTENIVYANTTNTWSPQDLQTLCGKLELLTKINQVEILRIFQADKHTVINENKYGVHINMTDVENTTIDKLNAFLEYVHQQENDLTYIDTQLSTNENYMLQEHKENTPLSITTASSSV